MKRQTFSRLGVASIAALTLGVATPAVARPAVFPASQPSYAAANSATTDGRIVFSSDCQIYTINPDGTAMAQVTHLSTRCADFPAWSPDSTRIAYMVFSSSFDRASIYSSGADGSDLRLVTTDGAGYFEVSPDYAPDGQRIVYSRCRPDPPGGCAIYSVGVDGTDRQPLTTYGHGVRASVDTRPQVSPDGTWLTFSRFGWKGILVQVWLMPMDLSAPAHPITPARLGGRSAKWMPDGRTVTFAGGGPTGLGFHVYKTSIMPPAGRTQLTFLPWPNGDISPAPSPSGTRIAFISDRRYADACCNELFLMHADGSHQHLVTGDLLAGVPDWGTASLAKGSSDRVVPPSAAVRARAAHARALIARLEGEPTVSARAR